MAMELYIYEDLMPFFQFLKVNNNLFNVFTVDFS